MSLVSVELLIHGFHAGRYTPCTGMQGHPRHNLLTIIWSSLYKCFQLYSSNILVLFEIIMHQQISSILPQGYNHIII
jgi:hypothetical protein